MERVKTYRLWFTKAGSLLGRTLGSTSNAALGNLLPSTEMKSMNCEGV